MSGLPSFIPSSSVSAVTARMSIESKGSRLVPSVLGFLHLSALTHLR